MIRRAQTLLLGATCLLLLLLSFLGGAEVGAVAAPARAPRTTADQVIQVKLRDLFDIVPKKDEKSAAEIILRLVMIEQRLAAIEGHLKSAPIPLPAPVPVTGTRKP